MELATRGASGITEPHAEWTGQARTAGSVLDVEVLDVAGRRVTTLRGVSQVQWDGRGRDGRNVPAGVYFLRVRAGDETETRRVVKTR